MRAIWLMLAVGLVMGLVSCSSKSAADQAFETLAGGYIENMLEMNPEYATYLGDHRYDHLVNDYSLEGLQKEIAVNLAYLDSLAAIDAAGLDRENRIDYEILVHSLKEAVFRADTLRGHIRNPLTYNVGGVVYGLLARDFAPLEERLKNVGERLKAIPGILEEGKKNLDNPPRMFTETAIRQNQGTIGLIRDELNGYLRDFPELQEEIRPAQEAAVAALEEYGKWLEEDLLPRSNGDFRLGNDIYRAKLRYSLHSDMTPEKILQFAEEELPAVQIEMYNTARELAGKYFPEMTEAEMSADTMGLIRKVIDRLADDHPTAENVVNEIKACLRECEEFVRAEKLVSLPEKPIKVIVMPEFERGVAIGYCDSPGPLEEKGQTFYSIAPPPDDWDAAQVESYFREYNNYMLRDLTIHEGIPGHYLQIAAANQVRRPTLIRAIMGSGTFIEGWATYCEQLMAEHGFGGPEVKMQMLKMRLRMIINAIIDQKIHTAGMTEEEAMAMMMEQGFQEESEAAGKWRRACLTSTQLSTYYVGNVEINDIRDAYRAKHGEGTDMKVFHDKLISYGSPAPKYVKELMGL